MDEIMDWYLDYEPRQFPQRTARFGSHFTRETNIVHPRPPPQSWPSAASDMNPTMPSLRKRTSDMALEQESPDGAGGPDFDGAKRQRAESSKTSNVIVISDSEGEDDDADDDDDYFEVADIKPPPNRQSVLASHDIPSPALPSPIKPPGQLPSAKSPPLDHLGRPLSDAALAAAREYWDCQRKLDACPFDDKGAQGGTALPFDLLLQLSWSRRSYTRLVLGRERLEPGTRTYEPPYIEPLPPASILAPGQAPDSAAAALPDGAAPATAQVKPKTEPVLCPEQQELVELAASGKNIFYTGSAGCGKSTVLHAIRTRLRNMGKTVRVMAPTGKVALAINGSTTWTFAGWTPDHHKRKLELLEKAARGKTARKRFRQTDTIIIDEISMVENLHFERLNAVMKVGRSNSLPFGGVQVIVTGDFCQLPPVKPFQHCITCGSDLVSSAEEEDTIHRCPRCKKTYFDKDKWAFRSNAWKECGFIHIHLKSIHRQNDSQFISMLQKCRLGIPFTADEVDILMKHKSVTANAVKLFSTREEVRRTNEEAFARLKTPPHPYQCLDKFLWDSEKHPHLEFKGQKNPDGSLRALDDHRFDRRIELKIGMLVVLLVNLNLEAGLCNGSQGIIAGFEAYDPNKLPRKVDSGEGGGIVGQYATIKETLIREFAEQQRKDNESRGQKLFWPVVRFLNGMTTTIMPECQVHELGDKEPYSLLCRIQIPLAAAWALSIHKSQGMTLDRVIVDLSRAFSEGQVYVALSRATSLQGLKIEGNPEGLAVGKGGDEQVRQFLTEKFGM